MWISVKKAAAALAIGILFSQETGAFEFPPGNDTLLVQVTREAHPHEANEFWEPYGVWWVEDASGRLVKILFITFYDDNTEDVARICGKFGYLYALTYYRARFGDEGCPDNSLGERCNSGACPDCPFDYADVVDGITGCSEPLTPEAPSIMTRPWDLTNRKGEKVPSGQYFICYSAVIRDDGYIRPGRGQDKVFKVPVTLGSKPFDTDIPSPPDILGQADDPHFRLASIRVALGANSLTGGGGGPIQSSGGELPNRPPAAPTAKAPPQSGFCGRGSALSAALVLFFLKFRRKPKKS